MCAAAPVTAGCCRQQSSCLLLCWPAFLRCHCPCWCGYMVCYQAKPSDRLLWGQPAAGCARSAPSTSGRAL